MKRSRDAGAGCPGSVTVAKVEQASQHARSLIEASPFPMATISPEVKTFDVNDAATTVTGVACQKLARPGFPQYFTDPEQAREGGWQQVFAKSSVTDYALTIGHSGVFQTKLSAWSSASCCQDVTAGFTVGGAIR